MEVIELHHEVCYRSLDELLNDVCPRSSMVALSSVKIKSHLTTKNAALAILSEEQLVIVQDIQDSVDYISADNLLVIELDNVLEISQSNGLLSLQLTNEPEVVLQETRLESALPLSIGIRNSFSTLSAAIEELVLAVESSTLQIEESSIAVNSVPAPTLNSAPVPVVEPATINQDEVKEDEPVQSRKWGWAGLIVFLIACGALYFIPWNSSHEPADTELPLVGVTEYDKNNQLADGSPTTSSASDSNKETFEPNSDEGAPILQSGDTKELRASSFRETIYGEVWPNEWKETDGNLDMRINVTKKGPIYQLQYSVNGKLKQSSLVIYDNERSKKLTKQWRLNDSGISQVNSYSDPSSDNDIHIDVLDGTLTDLITTEQVTSRQPIQVHLSIESASYAVAFQL